MKHLNMQHILKYSEWILKVNISMPFFVYTGLNPKLLSIFSSPEPLSVVCGVSHVMRKPFYLNIFSSETAHWI